MKAQAPPVVEKSSSELLLDFQGLLVSPRALPEPSSRLLPPARKATAEVKEVPFVFATGRLSPPSSRLTMANKTSA